MPKKRLPSINKVKIRVLSQANETQWSQRSLVIKSLTFIKLRINLHATEVRMVMIN